MVSVIVPIYNAASTIQACIESILNQSENDLELILIDDGSTDESGTICDTYLEKDQRVRIIHQENKGRTVARWNGVKQSSGEWLTFVDADDTLPVHAIQYLLQGSDDDSDIVFGNGYSLSPEKRTHIPIEEFRHLAVRADGMIGVPWGSLYRRTVVTSYLFDLPRHMMMGEDYIYWLRLVFTTEKPVRIVYEHVYEKGDDHTSNVFQWTADYCYELNEWRKSAVPVDLQNIYFDDMLSDRIANLFAVSVCCHRKEWKKSRFYQDILDDLKTSNKRFSLKQKLFLAMPKAIKNCMIMR